MAIAPKCLRSSVAIAFARRRSATAMTAPSTRPRRRARGTSRCKARARSRSSGRPHSTAKAPSTRSARNASCAFEPTCVASEVVDLRQRSPRDHPLGGVRLVQLTERSVVAIVLASMSAMTAPVSATIPSTDRSLPRASSARSETSPRLLWPAPPLLAAASAASDDARIRRTASRNEPRPVPGRRRRARSPSRRSL